MTEYTIIRFMLECMAAAICCYAVYREKDLIKFEHKAWVYTKAFFKAFYYTMAEKLR